MGWHMSHIKSDAFRGGGTVPHVKYGSLDPHKSASRSVELFFCTAYLCAKHTDTDYVTSVAISSISYIECR